MMKTDPRTTEGRAELRSAAEAVGKRARWYWDRIEDDFHVHESAWNVATISSGPTNPDEVSAEEIVNIERRTATFIATADPETVCKLLDAFDRVQSDLDRLMSDLNEITQGLGDWHDSTEYLAWAGDRIREIWLRSKGLDLRGRPLEGD